VKIFPILVFIFSLSFNSCNSNERKLKKENEKLWEEYHKKEEELKNIEKRIDSLSKRDEELLKELLNNEDTTNLNNYR
jgi:chromosome segregation ATPase